jgi:DNA repair exonuclease SbcCD ATPase subunit
MEGSKRSTYVSSSSTAYIQPEPPQRSGLLTALVAGAVIALVAANIYLYVQLDHVRTDVAKMQEKMLNEVSNLRDSSAVATNAQMRHIETLKEELAAARTQAANSANQAKVEANAHAEQIRKQLEAEEAQAQQKVASQISDVQQSANAANAKIADVSTDVGSVKTQVSATQDQLQKTIADLKSTRGDLGVQSGLIATNAGELKALRELGERNYVDIKLGKDKKPQRFGDIQLQLEKVDQKKNTYSVVIWADDKRVEKKDKSINEPVQFYVSKGGHIPYELVINSVVRKPEQIVGYLSTPKVEATR